MKTINFVVATPTEGEGIESLNEQKYINRIAGLLRKEFEGEYRVSAELIENDGTAESKVVLPDELEDDYELQERAERALMEAEGEAFTDEDCYDLEDEG